VTTNGQYPEPTHTLTVPGADHAALLADALFQVKKVIVGQDRLVERVMVCLSSNALAPRVIRAGARIAGRFGSKWFAVYVETPHEQPGRISPADADALQRNIRLAESLGATVVRVKAERLSDGLIAFARYEGITHVIMGQSARSRWELMWRGSPLDKLLSAVPDAAVQVVPLTAQQTSSGQ